MVSMPFFLISASELILGGLPSRIRRRLSGYALPSVVIAAFK
jgi:hypothetical protein